MCIRDRFNAGVDFIKLIDQDQMTMDELYAVVEESHKLGLKVVAHGHRPEEIRRGLKVNEITKRRKSSSSLIEGASDG